ncbi:Malonyl-CoA decarboxylase (MCD) [Shimia sp. SK013]|uniref:malonyl-CoA decarboxylase n=1 Tax=Shimia sp. SK013 TaxID=1389006 RepID=UPI0006B5EBBA|nr:malonyl-CoA decarboxylase [Shimia sp. SK013]KPA22253.1 Malonyl-CoA decarboxylase (MCD) [Shimia sp. SK013]
MQRNWFLGDLLSQLFDRRGQMHGKDDARSITELCEALLSAEGEVSGFQLASTVLDRYRALRDDEKVLFFRYLNDELDIDAGQVSDLAIQYSKDRDIDAFKALSVAAEPRRQELLRRLNQPTGATQDLVAMRVDLLRILKTHPDLRRTDLDFVHLLRSWFNRGFLVLKQISWDTPARILDKVVAYEAVHQISDLEDLRRRLYPPDRRCFAFFHPSMPDEPLIFVEVALTETVPGSIDELLSEQRDPLEADQAEVAVFYSISNCQKGLAGISFGNLLIKQVVSELALDLPGIQTFVTLSPIPGFNRWLETQQNDETHGPIAVAILAGTAPQDDQRAMAARYLLTAKRKDGVPIDPVARFHLGNGAEVHDIHAGADTSANGMAQSSGAMVNYLYNLKFTEQNHEEFATHATIAASRSVQSLATAAFVTKSKETTA